MQSRNRSNGLLVELLIVIMFFMLAATVLLQVFAAAEQQSRKSGQIIRQLNFAQDMMDQLYQADEPETLLSERGFTRDENGWLIWDASNETRTLASCVDESRPSGILRRFTVTVTDAQDQPLITLNNARYLEATP